MNSNLFERTSDMGIVAPLLYASLLALRMLADPPRRLSLNFKEYLDHSLGCLNPMNDMDNIVLSKSMVLYLKVLTQAFTGSTATRIALQHFKR
jgi:hypothetical protein